jgi:hypothetical protein
MMLNRKKSRLIIALGAVCTIGANANSEAESPVGPGANTQVLKSPNMHSTMLQSWRELSAQTAADTMMADSGIPAY